jgi:hypothetical protein
MAKTRLSARATNSDGKLTVRSALNPILWLCGLVTVPAMTAAVATGSAPPWLLALIFIPVVSAAAGFFFLLLHDRDKLQSEEYQLRKQSMELMQQKGDLEPALLDSTLLAGGSATLPRSGQ